ncbi:glycosyltransferase [Hippea alviniae]|uniref:glycosyltransferase n=1 Tax=Hippea alviniae TaxID=1279027 RepID=UPI0003B44231|nr:glycosyltransferase [Hippea alviniae]
MRMLFVIPSLGMGEAERVLSLLANYFSSKLEVHILTICKSEIFYDLRDDITVHMLDLCGKSNGRLNKVKQFDVLIDIYSNLDAKKFKLYIIGDGEERENLKNIIKGKKLENSVRLIGRVKDIERYYARAKIFALTSRFEAFSNVLIEAMSCGCAVISFDCPYGPAEIISDNIDGLLVRNQDKEEFLIKLSELVKNDNLIKRLSENAIEKAKKYSFNEIVKMWEKEINRIIR